MLDDQGMQWLVQQIIGTAELLGHEIKPTSAAMLAEDLSTYPRQVLAAALARVRTEHTGRLTPKVIIDRIDEAMGRPASNEAWAQAVTALDERATVVWTEEMSQAWGVARPIAAGGDMVGARMAFIAAYERLVRTARDERRLPVVTVSIGWDGASRTSAVERAVQLGYLPADQALQYLPAPAAQPGFNPVALLEGRVEVASDAPPELAARLSALRDELAMRAGMARRRSEAEARLQRMRLRRRKAEINAAVMDRMAEQGNGAAA